jgi:subfamily B ATP-binding cassette protein MsbA
LKNYLNLLRYVKNYKPYAVLNIVFNILSALFGVFSITLVIPFIGFLFGKDALVTSAPALAFNLQNIKQNFYYFISEIVRDNTSTVDPNAGKIKALLLLCGAFLIALFLKNLFRYLAMYYIAFMRNGVIKDIRNEMYDKILALPLQYYSNERKGDIMSRISNDVMEIEWSILSALEFVFREPFTIVLTLAILIGLSPQLTLTVFIVLPIAGLLIGLLGSSLRRSSAKAQGLMGQLFSNIEETLGGLRIIKAFTAEPFQKSKFYALNETYTKTMVRVFNKRDASSPVSEVFGSIATVIVIYFGGKLVLESENGFSAEDLIGYIAMFSQIIPPAKAFSTAYNNIQKGLASVERINKILDADVAIYDVKDAVEKPEFTREVVYQNISFSYADEPVLKNINLTIEKGKTVALVGPSGGGKSTLADLLPRFYDVHKGAVLIDGVDLKNIKTEALRKLIGVVTQESILFNDTIRNNIAFGMPGFTDLEVEQAARIANAHEFIELMPDGYQTNIGDRGSKLSGGQRQRISIARAILKNPPILILDEATSALDTESEKLVQDALTKLMANRTTLVIAHRLSTIQHADEIVVLQRGEIVERGRHADLLKIEGVYKKLYDMQGFA